MKQTLQQTVSSQFELKPWNNTSLAVCLDFKKQPEVSLLCLFWKWDSAAARVEATLQSAEFQFVMWRNRLDVRSLLEGAAADVWRECLQWIRSLQLPDSSRSWTPLRLFTLRPRRAAAESLAEPVSSRNTVTRHRREKRNWGRRVLPLSRLKAGNKGGAVGASTVWSRERDILTTSGQTSTKCALDDSSKML